jgi:cbb3-type cytochrome oxidase maturation protein
MSALFILIFISMIVAGFFLVLFLLAVKKGQYEDDYTPSVRMLFDDASSEPTNDQTKTINPQP